MRWKSGIASASRAALDLNRRKPRIIVELLKRRIVEPFSE
jgi:hypothetical protein